MPVDAGEFRNALARFASGVTVVTARTPDGGDRGMTASAFCSLSLDPPLILVCVRKGNAMDGVLQGAAGFAVNLLGQDQVDLSNRFAGYGAQPADRVDDLQPAAGPYSGAAWLPGAIARLDCALHQVLDGGDHHIYLGRVEAVDAPGAREDQRPLLYFAGAYRAAGEKL